MPCKVGTIRQIHQRLQDEGFFISEYTLRRWVKTGKLDAVFVGSKALISFDKVLDILNNSSAHIPAETPQANHRLGG